MSITKSQAQTCIPIPIFNCHMEWNGAYQILVASGTYIVSVSCVRSCVGGLRSGVAGADGGRRELKWNGLLLPSLLSAAWSSSPEPLHKPETVTR
jgi:hypothetical protein